MSKLVASLSKSPQFIRAQLLILFVFSTVYAASAQAATPLAQQTHRAYFTESGLTLRSPTNTSTSTTVTVCTNAFRDLGSAESDCNESVAQAVVYNYSGYYGPGVECGFNNYQTTGGWSQTPGTDNRWQTVVQVMFTNIYAPCGGPSTSWSNYGVVYVNQACPAPPTGGSGGTPGYTIDDSFGQTHDSECLYPAAPPNREPNSGCIKCKSQSTPHPINEGAGNKQLQVTDYHGGGAFPLVFTRTYNSIIANESASAGGVNDDIGKGWISNLGGDRLYINSEGPTYSCQDPQTLIWWQCVVDYVGSPPVQVTLWRTDGSQSRFDYAPGLGTTPPSGTALTLEATGSGQLFFVTLPAPLSGSGFEYVGADGSLEYFDMSGLLQAVQSPAGLLHTFQYNGSGQLSSVTDSFGHQMTLAYDSSGRVQTLTTPAGSYSYAYDTHSNLSQVTYPDSSTIQYKYEDTGFPSALTGIIDEDGNRYATYGYDANGYANSEHLAGGVDNYSITYTTDANGEVTGSQVTEPSGLTRTLGFTTVNGVTLLTSATNPCTQCGDNTQSLTYDSNGYVQSKTDFDNNVTQYVHDAYGNETSRTEAYGTADARTITTAWNYTVNQPSLITEPGRTTAYTYDGVGHVLTKTVTDTATSVARTTTYTYYSAGTAVGLLETVTDPNQNVTSYTYDNLGNLATVTNALQQVTQITSYDANGMPLTIVDPNGVTTTLTYDARQRLLTRTVAGATTSFTYDAVGNLTRVTLPKQVTQLTGSYLAYSYDAAHRLTGITDAVGDSITYTLDNLGNRTAENTYDPNSNLQKTLGRAYNSLNQLITVTGGANQVTGYTPDSNGNVTGITDPMKNSTTQVFDPLNRLKTVVDPNYGSTKYEYDPLDRVQKVTDPNYLDTSYTYDAFGDVTQQTSPDTGVTTYTYDLDGNRLTKTDARGVTANYLYDALNRLTGITYPDASRDVSYIYDQGTYGIGHLTSITDVSGTTAYEYDDHGNTIQKTVTLAGHTFTVGYQYDTADNLTGMTYPSGLQVNYDRDIAERVTEVDANNSPVVSGVTYEPFGPITGMTYANGLTETRGYDQDYRINDITVQNATGPSILSWSFVDNADDDIRTITDNLNGANSQSFDYDRLNRLTTASGAYGAQGYQYDPDGNRTSETLNGVATTLTYDTASNKLLTNGTLTDQYDAVGNLVSDGSHIYNYDVTNRLAGYGGSTTDYLYNGLGQRVAKNPVDDIPADVSIVTPTSNTLVDDTVVLTADAYSFFGIASVQFQDGGTNVGSPVTAAPYTIQWDAAHLRPGNHTLTAIATDMQGNPTTSAGVTVIVTGSPIVGITSPSSGNVSGVITVSAYTNSANGIASVQFQLDGAPLGSPVDTSPYNYSWDTFKALGPHTLTAMATDNLGNIFISSPVSVTAVDVAPTVTGNTVGPVTPNTPYSGTLVATPGLSEQTLTYSITQDPFGGTVVITNPATGAYTYTSRPNFSSEDSFQFQVTDQYGTASGTATMLIHVIDQDPTATNGSVTTSTNTAVSGTLSGTKAFSSQTLMFSVSGGKHGTVTITNPSTGAFTYTPNTGYIGSDSFGFQVADSNLTEYSATASESITVLGATGRLSPYSGVSFGGVVLGATSASQQIVLSAGGDEALTGISISIGGTNPGEFSVSSTTCGSSLNAGSSCNINLVMSPNATGSFSAQLIVADSDLASPQTETLTGSGYTILASLTPTAGLSFGNVNTTSTKSLTATLTNNGTQYLEASSVTVSGGSGMFTISGNVYSCDALAPGHSCTITIKFAPTSDGSFSGTLVVQDDATNGTTQSITLTGTGVN